MCQRWNAESRGDINEWHVAFLQGKRKCSGRSGETGDSSYKDARPWKPGARVWQFETKRSQTAVGFRFSEFVSRRGILPPANNVNRDPEKRIALCSVPGTPLRRPDFQFLNPT
jgi:hypothetical protein